MGPADNLPFMPDAELFARAASGDGDALTALVGRHAAPLYALALRLTGDAARAADLTVRAYAGLVGGELSSSAPPALADLRAAIEASARGAGRLSATAGVAPADAAGSPAPL